MEDEGEKGGERGGKKRIGVIRISSDFLGCSLICFYYSYYLLFFFHIIFYLFTFKPIKIFFGQ